VSWVAAYGNARTDIEAYEDVGIPKEKTFIIGPYAGEKGTTPIGEDYRSHVDTVEEYPEARPMP
jgi:phosphatidate phosphatase PAH1